MKEENQKYLNSVVFEARENMNKRLPYERELHLLTMIKTGDLEGIQLWIEEDREDHSGTMSKNPFRQAMYGFIAGITLYTRAAIDGGVFPEFALHMSDAFIQRADACTTVEEIRQLSHDALYDFTEWVVHMKKNSHYKSPIIACNEYIYAHLHERITVEDLAEHCHLDAHYLSVLYKKETGISLTEFINMEKIYEAETLLRFTNYSYLDISTYLDYSSQSYFTSVFKSYTGLTPKKYRDKYYRIPFSSQEGFSKVNIKLKHERNKSQN